MDILDLMAAHRTVRAFLDEPVPDADLRRAVSAAQCAPTSSWVQAYALLHVTDAGERERLVELTGGQPQVGRAGAFLVVCADSRRHRLAARRAGRPYVANLETFLQAVTDATLFAQNLVLALESLGYGTCCIGALRNRLREVDALLAVPDDVFPLFGLCVGVADPAVPTSVRPRLPLDAVLMRDRYLDDAAMLAHIDAFDVRAEADFAARGHPGRTWTGGFLRLFVQAMRPDLRAYYASKGASFD